MRNRLKTANNKHFSEELFYADHPSEGVTPCFNGNISAIRTAWTDTANTYIYAYDAQNRLLFSKRLTDYAAHNSELFGYDEMGNITSLKRFSDNRTIDDLHFSYYDDGNQLLSITDDGEDADLYSTIEYHNAAAQTDTTMFYDANGNLIRDLDRGISAIRYNILNLPDTIIFSNGNRIINLYDATGRKYKSITYTNIASVIPQQYDFAHYSFETDSIEYLVTEYTGNIEKQYSKRDTTIRIHNAIGYYSDSTYYHYIKDHLGNVCAVVNANADTVVQRTMYYASGVPMAQSWGRDTQPYLYNGKEFIESHGWNTYDYGFRGYYAPIARFTSIDPLAEQTPWQSPYAYANNNFINNIDWMGLDAITISGQAAQDFFSYLVGGGDWKTYDYSGWDDVTDEWEHGFFDEYGRDWYYYSVTAGPGGGGNWGGNIAKVTVARVVNASKYIDLCKSVGEYALKLGEQGTEAVSFGTNAWMADQWNPFGWEGAKGQYFDRSFLHKRGGYANSFKKAGKRLMTKTTIGKISSKLNYVSLGLAVGDIYYNGLSIRNGIDFGVAAAGVAAAFVTGPELLFFCTMYGFADIGITSLTGISISGWIDYGITSGINYWEEY